MSIIQCRVAENELPRKRAGLVFRCTGVLSGHTLEEWMTKLNPDGVSGYSWADSPVYLGPLLTSCISRCSRRDGHISLLFLTLQMWFHSSIHLPVVFQVWISTSTAWIFSVLHPSVLRQRNLKSVAGRCELDAQHLYGKHWGPGLMSDLKTEC